MWFSTSLTVGSTSFNLTLSTSLQHTWVPGAELCSDASDRVACRAPLGGEFPGRVDGVGSGIAAELGEMYGGSLLPWRENDPQTPLSLRGKGKVSKQGITVESSGPDASSFDLGEDLTVGVFTAEAPNSNGFLSLPQIASELFMAGATPGNNFHLWIGASAPTNDTRVPAGDGSDGTAHTLVFGGYDERAFDLNQTQQYRLGAEGQLQAELGDLVYRGNGPTSADSSLIEDAHAVVVDTTTPYLWLPQKSVDELAALSGAAWDESMDAYIFADCYDDDDCMLDDVSLDFVLTTGQTLSVSFLAFFQMRTSLSADRLVLPVRALKDDAAPIVLGRAVMSALHLWVDYTGGYFGLRAVDLQEYVTGSAQLAGWGADHAPITNTAILLAETTSAASPSSVAGGGDDDGAGVPVGAVAVICGGVAVVACAGLWLLRRRRRLADRLGRQGLAAATTTGPPKALSSDLPTGNYYQLHELGSKVTLPQQAHVSAAPRYEMPAHRWSKPEQAYGGYHQQQQQFVHEMPTSVQQTVIHEMPAQAWK